MTMEELQIVVDHLEQQFEKLYGGMLEKYDERNYVIISKQISSQRGQLSCELPFHIVQLILLICKLIFNANGIEKQLSENVSIRYESLQHRPNVYDEPYYPLYLDIPKQSLKNLERNIEKHCYVNNNMLDTFYNIISQIKKILKSINVTHIYYDNVYLEVNHIGDTLLVDCDDDILYNMMYNKANWNIFIFINEMLNVKTAYFDEFHDFIACFITIIRYLPQSELEYFHKKMSIFIGIVMDEMEIDLHEPNNCTSYNTKFLVIFTYLGRLRHFSYNLDYVNEIDGKLIKYAQNAMSNYIIGDIEYGNKISFKQFEKFINEIINDKNVNIDDRQNYVCYYSKYDHERMHKLMLKFMNYFIKILSEYEYEYDNNEKTKYVDYLFPIVFGYFHNLEYNNGVIVTQKPIFEQYLKNRFTVANKVYEIEQMHPHFNIIYEL
jgi:hypothetical protein